MKEERILKTIFNKSGNGYDTNRLTIPSSWVKDMGIDRNSREVIAVYDDEKKEIKIKKKL